MGEALLVKALGYSEPNPLDNVPVVATACSLLVTVRDSGGNKLVNMPVHCKDGSTWYNYNTNDQGMVLFQCTSGAANIVAWNYSILDSYNVIDQTPATMNVDAPVATKNHLEMNLGKITGRIICWQNMYNQRFLDTNTIFVQMVGGGGGGRGGIMHWWQSTVGNQNRSEGGVGGGGGAYNEVNFAVDRQTLYNIIRGDGGSGGARGAVPTWDNTSLTGNYGTAGGTTSAFGISAIGGCSNGIGGGSGNFKGGDGGTNTYYIKSDYNFGSSTGYAWLFNSPFGKNANYANSSFPYGGGGGVGWTAGNEKYTFGYATSVFPNFTIWAIHANDYTYENSGNWRAYGGLGGANGGAPEEATAPSAPSYGGGGGGGSGRNMNTGYYGTYYGGNGGNGGIGAVFITL